MNGAAVCSAGGQVAGAIVADLRGVETGFKADNLRQLLWSWRHGTLGVPERGIGGLIGEALNQVDGLLRNRSEHCFPAIPHYRAKKIQVRCGQWTAVKRRGGRGGLGTVVGILNSDDLELGVGWNSH